jgi:DNA-binding CsgD family transcriptional regulator
MERDRTARATSPLAGFLRDQVERVLASFQAAAAPPADSLEREALTRFLLALDALAAAADELDPAMGKVTALSERERAYVLVAGDDAFAEDVRRSLGSGQRVVVAPAEEKPLRESLQRRPALIVGRGAAGHDLVRRIHALQPGVPTMVVAQESEVQALLETFARDPVIVLKDPRGAELGLAVRAVLSIAEGPRPPLPAQGLNGQPPVSGHDIEPRSYAHLAGLLPRALERSVAFDIGAAVIARPGTEPLVDVHAPSHCPEETLELVRQRAVALFKLMVGGVRDEQDDLARPPRDFPIRSSMYFPLASEGGVVGLTYLASFRAGAFSSDDERILAALASHASGAYRRLESTMHRLRLSPRQSQVLALIASGLSDKEVASRLGVAHRTVRTHVDRLLREHGLRSRTEAVAAWLRGQQG